MSLTGPPCPGWYPPIRTARWSLTAVKEKLEDGGGLGPVVVGMDHLPAESEINYSCLLSTQLHCGCTGGISGCQKLSAFRVSDLEHAQPRVTTLLSCD